MNLLIVDDQPSIVASLLTGISWRDYGFDNVFSATSVLSAKEILLKEKVEILLTDIEMPVENGISLLSWVRERDLHLECIFLTSHPDFFFAKQAISLSAADYVLQPARNEDIIRAVEKARDKIVKYQRTVDVKLDQFSSAAQNTAIRKFFETWPEPDKADGALSEKIAGLKEMGIDCHEEDIVFILWVEIVRWTKIPGSSVENLSKYRECMNYVLDFVQARSISYSTDDIHFYTVIFNGTEKDIGSHIKLFMEDLLSSAGMVIYISMGQVELKNVKLGMDHFAKQGREYLDSGERNHFLRSRMDMMELPKEDYDVSILPEGKHYKNYYEQIIDYIHTNIDQPLTRQHIAKHLFLSPDYVNTIVKTCTGCSCTELIVRIKMSRAKKLLESSRLPVGDIARQVGYTSFAYFSKVYKDTYQKTPRESRN